MSIPPTAGNNFQCSAAISWILSLGEKFADADETFCARPPCTKWACHEAGTIAAASSYSNITVARYLQFRKVCIYRVTILGDNNLPLTWIWYVPSSCLGSR